MKDLNKVFILILNSLILFTFTACSNFKDTSSKRGENKVINIEGFASDNYLEAVAREFEKNNPGIKINIKEHLPKNRKDLDKKAYDESKDKFTRSINTELMAGGGPDIILCDSWRLPYQEYINKGLLVDLNKLIENDREFNKDEYYMNIFKGIEYREGLYTLPTDIDFGLLRGAKDIKVDDKNWTWEDFYDLGKNKNENDYVVEYSSTRVFAAIFGDTYEDFVNENKKSVNFDSEEFINLLKYSKKISDDKVILSPSEKSKYPKANIYFENEIYYETSVASKELLAKYDDKRIYREPSGNGKVNFRPGHSYAMNNNSKNKDIAWKFMKFLISSEMQSSPNNYLLPVNKIAFEEKIKKEHNEYIKDIEKDELDKDKAINTFDEITEIKRERMLNANKYVHSNRVINDIVFKEIETYFSGKKSAEEVAKNIQKKVLMYLNEQY
ncbi:putative extracellular solute-binding protein [Gottschalkia acidurici 9a]|uniref:Extracellular solute-binding protein n=1 Tax=Gottschalkia acidurici (strain ATCC 7906 / DSM 604 / BCRC 14475 / CIP 104303 / KCTC 5404 / NCIMB 10678 / 9a) TaxID=1128398 RepID=K0AYU7_GOTA9|nr:extracellular solute-binding protein [Gottschalkia acidurici]AFS78958.1 putative extracellular solute-binding protein [Gottschalkia acidurici 9a]